MSRHLPSNQQRQRVLPPVDNPYQGTTVPAPSNSYNHQPNGLYKPPCREGCYSPAARNHQCCDLAHDALLSDDTFTDTNTYYEYYQDHGYHTSPKRERPSDCMFSDDSGSTKLPYYEYEDVSLRRHSRNTSSDRSFNKKAQQLYRNNTLNTVLVHKDVRRVYPNQENICDRLCQETQRCLNETQPTIANNLPRRGGGPLSRISSDRPQSSHSSGVTSAIVDGCGGRCQTFENVCYYFLQVAFTMGILIGASLCIAGALLRKSAARNLQVLVYIGALLFCVSVLLLGVQCSARRAARNRKKALRNAKRGAIPLETLPSRNVPIVQPQVSVVVDNNHRSLPVTTIPTSGPAQLQRPIDIGNSGLEEQQGVPWWRRKELTSNF